MIRCTNREMGAHVAARREFRNSKASCYALWKGDRYVVWSYGVHWPLFVWTDGMWFGNKDTSSVTTGNHRNRCDPGGVCWVDKATLNAVLARGAVALLHDAKEAA